MKKICLLLVLLSAPLVFACNCNEFSYVQKVALKTNKLILVHFANHYIEDDNGAAIINPIQEKEGFGKLMDDYLYVCSNKQHNVALLKKYNVTKFPQLLIIDANGKEIYRFTDVANSEEFGDVLQNFGFSNGFFANEWQQFDKDHSYHTALRMAQKYFDFSLLVDPKYKKNVFNVGRAYIEEAERLLSERDQTYAEKMQKIALLKMYRWAYEKNFSFLDQELSGIDASKLFQSNNYLFYFLKYVTSKGLKQDDFPQIEAKAKTIDGFESLVQKADIILAQQA